MSKYYHATKRNAFKSILQDEVIKRGFDGIVYLAETYDEAVRFIALRAFGQDIVVLEIEFDDEASKKIEETFDHNPNFFRCKAFGYPEDIPADWICGCRIYGSNT